MSVHQRKTNRPDFSEMFAAAISYPYRENMAEKNTFPPGTLVKVIKGAFADRLGVVLDHANAVDARGAPLPATRAGYFWVMLTLNDTLFPAHLFEEEMELVGGAKAD